MTTLPSPFSRRAGQPGTAALLLAALSFALASTARAQSFCASDGQPTPRVVVERFISADCEICWATTAATPPAGALVIDWIVPSARGDDAPLSAAATRDALERLEATGQPTPAATAAALRQTPVRMASKAARLRVAHGLPLNGYVGASIELQPVSPAVRPGTVGTAWTAWLVLVESIAAGSDGTQVARNLVRNVLVQDWDPAQAAPSAETPPGLKPVPRLFESRAMGVPEGARPERLEVVGWVQDASGRIMAAAQSRCIPPGP